MPTVNLSVLYTEKWADRVDFMLLSYDAYIKIVIINKRRQEEVSGGDWCVYGVGYGVGVTGVYISPSSSSCIYQICTAFCVSVITLYFFKQFVGWCFETMNILFSNNFSPDSFSLKWWFLSVSITTIVIRVRWFFSSVILNMFQFLMFSNISGFQK